MTKQKLEAVKNTGEVKVLEEFKKEQNIDITFKAAQRDGVTDSVFYNIKGYSLHGPYLVIREQDDTEYVFSMENIEKLKLFYTIKE